MTPLDRLHRILDLARWAPSGDNTQNARFEIIDPLHAVVHGFDTRDHCVYDLDGHPSQISLGALLETASIAASTEGLAVQISRRSGVPDAELRPTFDLHFSPDPSLSADPLADVIKTRSVQRRPLSMRPLTRTERQSLEAALPTSHSVLWLEPFGSRLKMAVLLFHSAKLRLIMREAYEVHRDVIQWKARYSEDKIPDRALGTDPLTTRLMQFVMRSWGRVEFFNRFLAGTWAPRLQLDLIPGIACAAHFVLLAQHAPRTIDDYVEAGRAMQRFWLTATHLGLMAQPEITPLVFARYARESVQFSTRPGTGRMAEQVQTQLTSLLGANALARATFMGRIGAGPAPQSRSLRHPFESVVLKRKPQT